MHGRNRWIHLWYGLPWNGIYWANIVLLLSAAAFFGLSSWANHRDYLGMYGNAEAIIETGDTVKVVLVLNGDELVVEKGDNRARVRMLGIHSFDPVVNEREITAFGDASVRFLRHWILNHNVRMVFDAPIQDSHGRYLAYIFSGDMDINRRMVSEGLSMVYTEFPTQKERDYLNAEMTPRAKGVGLWGGHKARTRIIGLRRGWSKKRRLRDGVHNLDPLLEEER